MCAAYTRMLKTSGGVWLFGGTVSPLNWKNTDWTTQQIPFPFFNKLDPGLRLSDLELFTACWAETKGETLRYNPNTMNLPWNKAAWAIAIPPRRTLAFQLRIYVWQGRGWKVLPTWWPMFPWTSLSLWLLGRAGQHPWSKGVGHTPMWEPAAGSCPASKK